MSFKEHVLMEIRTEIVARNDARRRRVRRHLMTAAAATGVAVAAAVAVPVLTGGGSPAYAVTENGDGTITLEIKEFRDPGKVEQDLRELGVTADVSYLRPGTRCAPRRGRSDSGPSFSEQEIRSKDPAVRKRVREAIEKARDGKAVKPAGGGRVRIDPRHIREGETAVMEFTENTDRTSGPEKPGVVWSFAGYLVTGPVKPCTVVPDPSWSVMPDPATNPEAYPPPGS
ncbi:hypothetical protein [Nonomuraea sp. NPDC050783]|uniref:hypothetical protein n=1 Tax=Nonomuraea sp. NPDC050783 TaxID=3154634 RepID=UPI003467379D